MIRNNFIKITVQLDHKNSNSNYNNNNNNNNNDTFNYWDVVQREIDHLNSKVRRTPLTHVRYEERNTSGGVTLKSLPSLGVE